MSACARVCVCVCLSVRPYVCVKTRGLLSLSTITGAMSVSAGSEPTVPGLHVVTVSPPRPASTAWLPRCLMYSQGRHCQPAVVFQAYWAAVLSLHCSCSGLLCTLLMQWSSLYTGPLCTLLMQWSLYTAHVVVFSVHCSCSCPLSTLIFSVHRSCSGLLCTLFMRWSSLYTAHAGIICTLLIQWCLLCMLLRQWYSLYIADVVVFFLHLSCLYAAHAVVFSLYLSSLYTAHAMVFSVHSLLMQ